MKTTEKLLSDLKDAYINLNAFKQISANNQLELLNKNNGLLFYTNEIKELAFSYISQLNVEGDFSIEFDEELLKFKQVE